MYGSECWTMRTKNKVRLERNHQVHLSWICGVKLSERPNVDSLDKRFTTAPPKTSLRSRGLSGSGTLPVVKVGLTSASVK